MEDIINEEVLTSDNPCAIFTDLNIEPIYELQINKDAKESEIQQKFTKYLNSSQ